MATLVLSTVGTMLGGPVGGAIGSLLGQTIDQQLFGPGPREGPRLGDLAVQTSSYGTPIPKVFGTMRVAGSIIWATDLVEHSLTEGAKGQPDRTTYSYSASFAVALSARRISGIGRIWADGKPIRSADGVFNVSTGFRFLDGSEDQPVDPLIASIEGIAQTPAYRGLAIALFEDLELAEFGNRIPFLTFEVEADGEDVPLAAILAETSGGVIAASDQQPIGGFAAHGSSMAAAVDQLLEVLQPALFDSGAVITSADGPAVAIASSDLGCATRDDGAAVVERSALRARSLPTAVTLGYYDAARDYQSGSVRAAIEAAGGAPERIELPAVIETATAKAVVATHLARRWAERDRLKLRLPPTRLAITPGTVVELEGRGRWKVVTVTIDALVVVAELSPVYANSAPLPGDPGRVLPTPVPQAAPTQVQLLELPAPGEGSAGAPVIVAAASAASVPLDVQVGARLYTARTTAVPAVAGTASTALGPAQCVMFDTINSVEVQLFSPDLWLESRDDDALAAGGNLAAIGDEIIQFANAEPLGAGRFRLSRLLRGRRGTEWAAAAHPVGAPFVLIDPARLNVLQVAAGDTGAQVQVTPRGIADGEAEPVSLTITGEAMRPPFPVHLRASLDPTGGLSCSWVRRSSLGWAWLDGVDAPIGCPVELYRARLSGPGGSVELETSTPQVQFTGAQTAAVGPGAIEISVVQVGELATSHPAILRKTIS